MLSPGSRQLRRLGETTIVQVDPNYHPDLCTTQGILPIETSIAIAHEMGHLIRAHDDGPGSMANILKNENPVRRDLGIPLRTQYDPPHVRRSNKYIYSIFSWTGLILSLLLTSAMSAGEQDKFRENAIDSGMSSSRYRSDDHHSTVLHFLPFGTETVMGITPQAIEEHSDYILRFSKIWPMESPFPRYEEHTFVKFLRTIFTSKTTTQRINTSFIRLKVKFPDATFYIDDTGVVWREDTRLYFQLTNEQMKDIATRITGYAGVVDLKMNEKK
ncbi:MAG TPA: hypothetical protein PLZ37_13980 [Nitrospira sp.]|nr:hypothetical protein [Nitrospira sp.]